MITQHEIENWFTFHPPKDDAQRESYELIRANGKAFARLILDLVPAGPEQDEAINRLREVVMWANAGVACALI